MGRNTGRGKVAYSWISPCPAKVGPTLGGGVLREVPVELEVVVKVASAWCEGAIREADSRTWRTLDSYMISLM